MNIPMLGALFLGGVVGYFIGFAWRRTKNVSLKSAVFVIGSVLTGAPILFMEGAGEEKWMYPVGIAAGVLWSRFSSLYSVLARGSRDRGARASWYMALAATASLLVFSAGLIWVATVHTGGNEGAGHRLLSRSDMPCRLVWVFLGKYDKDAERYIPRAAFDYAEGAPRRAVPRAGDIVVLAQPRNMIVTGFGTAPSGRVCDRMLVPPAGYRPETADEYIAGQILVGTSVLIEETVELPSSDANPAYVWALVGAP